MPDYLPRNDLHVRDWLGNFVNYAQGHLAELGLAAGDVDPLAAAHAELADALVDHAAKHAAAKSARLRKDHARAAAESIARALVGRLGASPLVGNDERAALGIPRRDKIPTRAPAPTGHPLGIVDFSLRMEHRLRIVTPGTPNREAKPRMVVGAEVWMALSAPGAAPPPIGQFRYVGTATSGRFTVNHSGADAGKTAHYNLRWVNTRGEKGPWGEMVSATVAG